ncbi:MAG: hypothetical protein R6W67_08390 [Bacteroidales bacterium]
MEEEKGFGNIIFYIILGIIAIVSSIKGKKKQQPEVPGGSKPSETGRSYFPDELFDDEEDESAPERGYWEETNRKEPVIDAPGRTAAAYSQELEGRYEEPMAGKFANEGVSALDHQATARRFEELLKEPSIHDGFDWNESEQETEDETSFNIDRLSEEFDARQAVIFSEIISRKEY